MLTRCAAPSSAMSASRRQNTASAASRPSGRRSRLRQGGNTECLGAVADRALDPEAVWGKFARDSPLEGGVTSELVSGIRGSGPHFRHFIPAPNARTRARGQRRKSRRCGPICRRGELVLEMKCWSLQVGFNVKAGVAGVWPAQTRQAPLVVFAPGASTASRCGGSSGPS